MFCSNATLAIVVEQGTKVNKQGKNNEEKARKSLQFATPCLGLGGTAEHPVTGPQLPPLGSLGGVVVDGGVVDQQLFLPLAAGAGHRDGRQQASGVGVVLLWAILSPAVRLGGVDAGQWLEDYLAGLELRESELEEQVGNGMKSIIEQETAAYIVDKAAEMGLTCTARVSCQAAEGGVYVPSQTQVAGVLSQAERDRISQMIQADLGVPAQRQFYYEEGLP